MANKPTSDLAAGRYATFQLLGDELVPDAVSAELGLAPRVARGKGKPRESTKPGVPQARQATGLWALDSRSLVASDDINAHISFLVDQLEPVLSELEAVKGRFGARSVMSCFFPTGSPTSGPEFSPSVLRRLARLDTSLYVNVVVASPG